MEEHLEKFYTNKLLTSEVGIPQLVDVDLESQLLWKEIWVGPKETTEEVANHTYTETDFVKRYKVNGIFNCKMKLQIDPIENDEKSMYVSQTLVNMFFLEAFENENYWDMMHEFLATPLLRGIISVDIKVLDVGFVHPYDENGNLLFEFESDDDFYGRGIDFGDDSGISPVAIFGFIVATLFFFAVGAIWYYLCFVSKGGSRSIWKRKKIRRSRSKDDTSYKGSSRTGSTNSDDSGDDSDESGDSAEETLIGWATANLDAWASAITSIPLRDVENKRRRKRGNKVVSRPYFRPCQEHSSELVCITESDNESWCSSVKSSRSAKSSRSNKSHTSRYSRSRTRRPEDSARSKSVESNVIYEGDAEDSAEDDEEQVQSSPLLIQRQVIKLMPSEDEVEDYRNNGFEV